MHYLKLLIVKSNDKEDAIRQVHNFMKSHEHSVWDWYEIGGRWKNFFGGAHIVPLKKALPDLEKMIKVDKLTLKKSLSNVRSILKKKKFNGMDAHYIKSLGEHLGGYFSNEIIIYNVEDGIANKLPSKKELNEYMVVVVDNHN